jgi:general secretion pathway protein A
MEYFTVLNLNKEPFSNSPDPEFFYHSREHLGCLQKLELSILLRRGLNVIIGDVGTGKTTLCRQLIRGFSKREEVDSHLVLDPFFVDANEFLTTVAEMLTGKKPANSSNNWQVKEYIKQYLYRSGVEQQRTTVLIIDEGQKLPVFCLEILREFLNYETNEYKLLQIVIFAQKEFEKTVQKHPNFADRINLYHNLKPLNFRDTRLMIKFRLEQSRGSRKKLDLFTFPALAVIYRASRGYPRKIINLCHQAVLTMIIQNRTSIGYFLVHSCARRIFPGGPRSWKKAAAAAVIIGFLAGILLLLGTSNPLKAYLTWDIAAVKTKIFSAEKSSGHDASTGSNSAALPAQVLPPVAPIPILSAAKPKPAPAPAPETEAAAPAPGADSPPEPAAEDTANRLKSAEDTSAQIPNRYAEILGQVTIRSSETLSRIIQKVYGSYNSKYFRSLILANPRIDDPDRVDTGQVITLPAVPAKVKAPANQVWWIQVAEKNSLEEAFDYLRTYPDEAPGVRLIPYWTGAAGTKFALVLKEYFSSEIAAGNQLNQLPPALSAEGKIISWWNEDTVFFADPFLDAQKNN